MSNNITECAGILTLFSDSNAKIINVHNQVPRQVMRLKKVRVEFDSAATALAQKIAYVDLPFLSNQQLIDPITSRFYLPIFLENAAVTLYEIDVPIFMSRDVHDTLEMNVRNSDGTLVSNMVHIALQFEFFYGHTS